MVTYRLHFPAVEPILGEWTPRPWPFRPPAAPHPDLDTSDTRLVVIVAPELHGRRDFAVIRGPDDTDADYASRCELLALLLDHADKG